MLDCSPTLDICSLRIWKWLIKRQKLVDFKFSGIHFDITLAVRSISSFPIIAMWPWIHRNIRLLFVVFFSCLFLFGFDFVSFSLFVYVFVLKKKKKSCIISLICIILNVENVEKWLETLVIYYGFGRHWFLGGWGWFSGCKSNIVSVTT